MILFYNKETGAIVATVDGRVHNEADMAMEINDSSIEGDIGKFVIGTEKRGEESFYRHSECLNLLKRFEDDLDRESPLMYIVKEGKLVKQS